MYSCTLRKLTVFILGMCMLFSVSLCFAEAPRVGCAGFSTNGKGRVGQQLCDTAYSALLKGLSERQNFKLVERAQLETILKEHGLNLTGLIDDATAARWGKLIGAQYMLICRIDYANTAPVNNLLYKTQKAKVKVSARLVDVETGMQKKMFNGEGAKSGGPKISVPFVPFIGGNTVSMVLGVTDDSVTTIGNMTFVPKGHIDLLASATEEAVQELLKDIEKNYPLAGKIIEIRGDCCVINLGAANGVKAGDRFNVVEEGKALRDLKTGEILDMDIIKIGKVKINEVSEHVASGKMGEKKRPFRKGDIVQKVVKD